MIMVTVSLVKVLIQLTRNREDMHLTVAGGPFRLVIKFSTCTKERNERVSGDTSTRVLSP